MYGPCIEDVNHEIYGGLYAQRIFGESFEEPPTLQLPGWNRLGGMWQIGDRGRRRREDGPFRTGVRGWKRGCRCQVQRCAG